MTERNMAFEAINRLKNDTFDSLPLLAYIQ